MKMKTVEEVALDIVHEIQSRFTDEELQYLNPSWSDVEDAAVQGQLKARQFYKLEDFNGRDEFDDEPRWYVNVLLMRSGDFVSGDDLDPKNNTIVCGHKVYNDDGETRWVITGTDNYFENPTHFRYI